MALYHVPVFAVELQSLLELEVFFVGPTASVHVGVVGFVSRLLVLSLVLASKLLTKVLLSFRYKSFFEGFHV